MRTRISSSVEFFSEKESFHIPEGSTELGQSLQHGNLVLSSFTKSSDLFDLRWLVSFTMLSSFLFVGQFDGICLQKGKIKTLRTQTSTTYIALYFVLEKLVFFLPTVYF